jgi:hypothetical protein
MYRRFGQRTSMPSSEAHKANQKKTWRHLSPRDSRSRSTQIPKYRLLLFETGAITTSYNHYYLYHLYSFCSPLGSGEAVPDWLRAPVDFSFSRRNCAKPLTLCSLQVCPRSTVRHLQVPLFAFPFPNSGMWTKHFVRHS